MGPFYAEIDAAGYCFSIFDAGGRYVEPRPTLIEITSLDSSLLGKRWDGSAWI